MKIDYMNIIKKGAISWALVGVIAWAINSFMKIDIGLMSIFNGIKSNPLMTIVMLIVGLFVIGYSVDYAEKALK